MPGIPILEAERRLNAVFMLPEYTCRLGPARPGRLPITSTVSQAPPGTGPRGPGYWHRSGPLRLR
jgi:hypothetical protein